MTGIVVLPVCWKSGESMGLTICCSIDSIINSLLSSGVDASKMHGTLKPSVKHISSFDHTLKDFAEWSKLVVYIKNGTSWGTGLVFDARRGLILTCSHVVVGSMIGEHEIYYNSLIVFLTLAAYILSIIVQINFSFFMMNHVRSSTKF